MISVSDWCAVDYRLPVVLPMPYGLGLSVNDAMIAHQLQRELSDRYWTARKATWTFEQSWYLEKQFTRHKDFQTGGCVYLLEGQNLHFKTVPLWIIEEQNHAKIQTRW